jgi:uncharacterized coiled-coil protein SlyX
MNEKEQIEFETKMAHLEMSVEELTETTHEQQKSIDLLTEAVKKLSTRIDAAKDGGLDIGPADEKPPHY